MSPDPEIPQLMKRRSRKQFWSRFIRWSRNTLVVLLLLAVGVLYSVLYAYRDLPEQLQSQVQQFEDCRDVPADTPGCEEPVVSPGELQDLDQPPITPSIITGRDGEDGEDGEDATQAQVDFSVRQVLPGLLASLGPQFANALSTYCAARNNCTAPPIQPRDGADGSQGPAGPPGATGAPGADSTVPGPPGVGVLSVTCSAVTFMEFLFTFTDGSQQTVSCGPGDPVTPVEPDPPTEEPVP